jgi:DNA-binding transcriptional LysR family regulator
MLDRLTLDQLRIVIAVAETGSFSGAARRLGRVQSAVSQSVQSLEATLGIPLFDRAAKVAPRPPQLPFWAIAIRTPLPGRWRET